MELITPYGGTLVELVVPEKERAEEKAYANSLPSFQISDRSLCDLECLAIGAFSPLDRFMGESDYRSVLDTMRLATGSLFPVPITLPLPNDFDAQLGTDIALRDSRMNLLAYLRVDEIYEWNLEEEADRVYGSHDSRHPVIAEMHRWGRRNVSGRLRVLQLPVHHDFRELRMTPAETRAGLMDIALPSREATGPSGDSLKVVAFQTRNPLHRVHEELISRALESVNGLLLLHPVVGMTKSGDVDHYTRVRTYKALSHYFNHGRSLLSLLPLAMRFAGPREAVWHSIIRRNYGASHLIVGRGHASPFLDSEGRYFHHLYEAQELVKKHEQELGVVPVCFQEMVYVPDKGRYLELKTRQKIKAGQSSAESAAPGKGHSANNVEFSSRMFKEEYLDREIDLPDWFARREVAEILRESHPPRHKQGICLWFTGLSGSGKSTIAEILTTLLAEHGRQITLLDGDVVRTHLSKGLGFSQEDRDTNIRRIGYVAAEISRHGGTVICAAISPYRSTRNDARNMVGNDNFIEIFVDTPLEVCEGRDIKGLYAKARRGEIKGFTGIDDPYERPLHPEVTLDTVEYTPDENAQQIIDYLRKQRFILGLN